MPLRTPAYLTLRQDDDYDDNILGDIDPHDLFEEFAAIVDEIKPKVPANGGQKAVIKEVVSHVLSLFIYGSNMIDDVGASLDITRSLCAGIMLGQPAPDPIARDRDFLAIMYDRQTAGLLWGD